MKQKILIIEDEPLIRNELKSLLQSNGYETAAPEEFSDVIGQIKAEQPHLILLDIKLPGTITQLNVFHNSVELLGERISG